MTDLIVIISFKIEYWFQEFKQRDFGIGVVPANHQNDTVHENQNVEKACKMKRTVGDCQNKEPDECR